jgi:hypothetical protein
MITDEQSEAAHEVAKTTGKFADMFRHLVGASYNEFMKNRAFFGGLFSCSNFTVFFTASEAL